jgi:excisionase family DNA binding protein
VVKETLAQLAEERGVGSAGTDGPAHGATDPVLLNARQTAEALGISPRTLWALTKHGELPHVRVGRAVRYRPADLDAWAEARKQSGMQKEASHG